MTPAKLTALVVLVVVGLSGCGASAHRVGRPAVPAARASLPDPCAVLSAAELASALGRTAPRGARTGPTCRYVAGRRGVQVQVAAATTENRAALRASERARPAGARVVAGRGYDGLATAVQTPVATGSAQAQLAAIAGGTLLRITLTAPPGARAGLVRLAAALGGSAASRLGR